MTQDAYLKLADEAAALVRDGDISLPVSYSLLRALEQAVRELVDKETFWKGAAERLNKDAEDFQRERDEARRQLELLQNRYVECVKLNEAEVERLEQAVRDLVQEVSAQDRARRELFNEVRFAREGQDEARADLARVKAHDDKAFKDWADILKARVAERDEARKQRDIKDGDVLTVLKALDEARDERDRLQKLWDDRMISVSKIVEKYDALCDENERLQKVESYIKSLLDAIKPKTAHDEDSVG